jgi:hypothetical protein
VKMDCDLLTVYRHVERNAILAYFVEWAEDWMWGSF